MCPVGCFLSAFVLSLAVKPSLESYYNTIENAARADDPVRVCLSQPVCARVHSRRVPFSVDMSVLVVFSLCEFECEIFTLRADFGVYSAAGEAVQLRYRALGRTGRVRAPFLFFRACIHIHSLTVICSWCGFLLSTMVTVIDIVRWELEGGAKGVPAAFPTSGGNQQRSPSGVAVPAVDSPGMVNPSFNPMHGSP